MYKAYDEKNDSPIVRTFIYMLSLIFIVLVMFILFFKEILQKLDVRLEGDFDNSLFFWLLLVCIISTITYLLFTRKNFSYYEENFSHRTTLNRRIKLWMLISFPFIFLFLSFLI
jgi:hypothetical protein